MAGYSRGWAEVGACDRLPAAARAHVTHGGAGGGRGDTADRGKKELYDWVQPRGVARGIREDRRVCGEEGGVGGAVE